MKKVNPNDDHGTYIHKSILMLILEKMIKEIKL